MEAETRSSGIPSKSISMSSSEVDGHAHAAHFAAGQGMVRIQADLRGRSKATESPVCPCDSR